MRNDSHFERGAIEVDMGRLGRGERFRVSEMEEFIHYWHTVYCRMDIQTSLLHSVEPEYSILVVRSSFILWTALTAPFLAFNPSKCVSTSSYL